MSKKPWIVTLFVLALAVPAAAVLTASSGPEEDRIIVLPDVEAAMDGNFDMDFEVDVDVADLDDARPMVMKVGKGRGYLGVDLVGITPELRQHFGVAKDAGVLVGAVEADSPAARAGIQVGDVLTAVDGQSIDSSRDLSRAVRNKKAGETVKLDLSRNRSVKQLTVTVAERPAREIRVGQVSPRMKKHAWVWKDGDDLAHGFSGGFGEMGRIDERLDELEKRLKDLETKLPPSK